MEFLKKCFKTVKLIKKEESVPLTFQSFIDDIIRQNGMAELPTNENIYYLF